MSISPAETLYDCPRNNSIDKLYGQSPSVFIAFATLPTPSISAPVRMSLSSFLRKRDHIAECFSHFLLKLTVNRFQRPLLPR